MTCPLKIEAIEIAALRRGLSYEMAIVGIKIPRSVDWVTTESSCGARVLRHVSVWRHGVLRSDIPCYSPTHTQGVFWLLPT